MLEVLRCLNPAYLAMHTNILPIMRFFSLLFFLSLAIITSCTSMEDDAESVDSTASVSYPKAEVKTADMACHCFTPLAEHSVSMQDWAAEYFDELLEEGNAIGDVTATLRQKEQTYFELLEEARTCYEDSLTAYGDFYLRGAPAFPFLMQEQCKEVFYLLMLDGGMAKQALYGQENTEDLPAEADSFPVD